MPRHDPRRSLTHDAGRPGGARRVLVILLGASTLWVMGCVSMPSPGLLGLVITKGKPFVIASSAQGHGWGYLSHPAMARLSNHELIVRYNAAGDNPTPYPKAELVRVTPAYSSDNGRTWQLGLQAVPEVERGHTHHLGLIETTNGMLRYRWMLYPNRTNFLVFVSKDGTVEPLDTMIRTPPGTQPIYVSLHRGVAMGDGRLIVAGYTRFSGDTKNRVIALQSTDDGRTFEYLATVAAEGDAPWGARWPYGYEGPCECSIARIGSNDLVCVMRTGVKRDSAWGDVYGSLPMLQAWSSDGGRSWTRKELDLSGVQPRLLRMSNGVLVLAFGRPGNSLVFSTNGGRTWGKEVAITPVDVRTTGYVALTEVEPGRLLVVYDMFNTDLRGFWLWEPKEVNGVFGVYVTVRRLVGGGVETSAP